MSDKINNTVYIISKYLNVLKWEFAVIINSSNNKQKSSAYSYNN